MRHALVLNATYEPLHVVSWQRALQLLFQGKVEVVESSNEEIRSVRITIKAPAVLRLLQYVPIARRKNIIRFSRPNIFTRDGNICQYCGKQVSKANLTLDHIIPVSKNGTTDWENIVTACKPCNQKKGDRTPSQAGMRLLNKPTRPNWLPHTHIQFEITRIPEHWKIYLNLSTK